MILYLDTSALVKAYITESSTPEVMKALKKNKIVASHLLAYVEANATFSRIKRENKITEKEYDLLKKDFSKDWQNYFRIETTQDLVEHAADLAEAFGLRVYDSVHLAAADKLWKQSKKPTTFACFDRHLNKAAKVLGLNLLMDN